MPPATAIQTFIQALQTGKTHFTEVAERIFSDPGNVPNLPGGAAAWAAFQQPNSLDRPLSSAIATFLRNQDMLPAELNHIDRWNNPLKETLRSRLARAIANGEPPIEFFWTLYDGDEEDADIGDHVIVFKTPRQKVKITRTVSGEVEIG